MPACYLCGCGEHLMAYSERGAIVNLCSDAGACAHRVQRKQIHAKALRKMKPLPPPSDVPDRRTQSTGERD